MPKVVTAALTLLLAVAAPALAQQVVDPKADTNVTDPAFAPGKGPVVLVDSGHDEFQTLAKNYAPFGALLTHDGYVVRDFDTPISAATSPDVRQGSAQAAPRHSTVSKGHRHRNSGRREAIGSHPC